MPDKFENATLGAKKEQVVYTMILKIKRTYLKILCNYRDGKVSFRTTC